MASNPPLIRLYLDEDVHPDLADVLRKNGLDCQTAIEAGMKSKEDEEQLEYATLQGRCILSFNVADFYKLALKWSQDGRAHPGILVTKQVSRRGIGRIANLVLQIVTCYSPDEMRNLYLYLK